MPKSVQNPKQYAVYVIINRINNKKYVGITTKTIEQRLKNHISRAMNGWKEALYCAIRKYGISNFTVYVIDTLAISMEELHQKEREYIKSLNTFIDDGEGYNMTRGGEGNLGWNPSKEWREKISKANKGVSRFDDARREEYSQRFSGEGNPRFGAVLTDETKGKISKALIGHPNLVGREFSEETRQKMSISGKKSKRENSTKKIEFNGVAKTTGEWAEQLGIGEDTLWRRLNLYGWSVERALTELEDGRVEGAQKHELNGKSQSLPQWAEEYGLTYDLVFTRVSKNGWTLEKALTTPSKQETSKITYNGRTQSKAAGAKELGISPSLLNFRLKKNSFEEVYKMSPPPKKKGA